jgi:hypothetical protein
MQSEELSEPEFHAALHALMRQLSATVRQGLRQLEHPRQRGLACEVVALSTMLAAAHIMAEAYYQDTGEKVCEQQVMRAMISTCMAHLDGAPQPKLN